MPGYILHLTEAELVCQKLQEQGIQVSDEWKNLFQLGCLLPDTKRKTEKITSHFWNPETMEHLAIAPDMNRFFSKYESQIEGPLTMGYWMHLQMDYRYVHEFWKELLEFRGEDGKQEELRERIRTVWLKNKKTEIPVDEFFSAMYYYGDYSRMNAFILNKYQLQLPVYPGKMDCPIQEVETEALQQVLSELYELRQTSATGDEEKLKVFDLPSLEAFIQESADEAAQIIGRCISSGRKIKNHV